MVTSTTIYSSFSPSMMKKFVLHSSPPTTIGDRFLRADLCINRLRILTLLRNSLSFLETLKSKRLEVWCISGWHHFFLFHITCKLSCFSLSSIIFYNQMLQFSHASLIRFWRIKDVVEWLDKKWSLRYFYHYCFWYKIPKLYLSSCILLMHKLISCFCKKFCLNKRTKTPTKPKKLVQISL